MVQSSWLAPFALIGREFRIELRLSLQECRLSGLGHRLRAPAIPYLPEQRVDDLGIVEQRKAETFLQSVRHGAVRR